MATTYRPGDTASGQRDDRAPQRRGGDFSLDEKYDRDEGSIYLTGIQALVRLPLDQHRADKRRGLHTGTFISGYRGSPLGGYDAELDRHRKRMEANHVVHQPGLNEELAATAVFGSQLASGLPNAQYDGVLGIWYGKGPGVDRTGDAFKHANLAGVSRTGGVLALAGDDPSCKSSTVASSSEAALFDALMPTIYPGNAQETLDLGLHGFALSRASGCWVGMKIVTNVADSGGIAEVGPDRITPVTPTIEFDGKPFVPKADPNLLPPHSVELERQLHYARLELARRYAWENKLNRVVNPGHDAWLGIMAPGRTYHDVRQALGELGLDDAALAHYGIRLLHMGMLFPAEPRIIREFARGLREILVVEEKRPFLELFARDTLYSAPDRPLIVGKSDEEERPLLNRHGELDPDKIARAIAARIGKQIEIPSVQARVAYLDAKQRPTIAPIMLPVVSGNGVSGSPAQQGVQLHAPTDVPVPARGAYFCSGCPHNRSTQVPEGLDSLIGAGIGCHSMSMWMDPALYGDYAGITQMGGEGAQWIGMAPFTGDRHMVQNVGDGTFFHSGQMAMHFAIASGVNITYKLLYNSAVAMTGGQDAVGAIPIPQLTHKLAVEGVKKIIITSDNPDQYEGVSLAAITEVWHRDRLPEAHTALAVIPGVTVLLHDGQCATEKRRLRKRGKLVEPTTRIFINERVCEGCGDCGKKSNCLSVIPVETEFGRKTQIHQSSCNKDYSCILGDCPSFMEIEAAAPGERANGRTGETPQIALSEGTLPEPELKVPVEGYAARMMGIGGTGVVTTSQILATAAAIDGLFVWSLDQTGLAQKGGAVVSDIKLSRQPLAVGKVAAGGADLYLGFDLLVANDAGNLATADAQRTIGVISLSKVPTGKMVTDTAIAFPNPRVVLSKIERATRREHNVYVDAENLSHALFGNHLPANTLLLGAAYQQGAVPISAEAIERAIELNGTAAKMNIAAFRWGRVAVADPGRVDAILKAERQKQEQGAATAALTDEARRLVDASGATGELRRLLEVRVPELIAYQDAKYAERYVGFVKLVAEGEARAMSGRTALVEAVAKHLYKLMAYKDEYEVARLHLDPAIQAAIREEFGEDARVTWKLHPPMLRAMGMEKKVGLGEWFAPGFKALKSMKKLRGTPLDPFGRAEVRRVERELIGEYREAIKATLAALTPDNHAIAVSLAELPDMVRGYEEIKLANVQKYREALGLLLARMK
jgi:indolepyruvate ferredoxin oxidoreductase